ncbi:MAG: flagellin [bacterium]
MDQTVSMGGEIAQVAAAAPAMFTALAARGFDLRMAAVGFFVNPDPPALGTGAPPGTPQDAISGTGTQTLYDNSTDFVNDVNAIGGALNVLYERGLDATLETLTYTGISAQMTAEPDAQRVFVLLTDADSDDAQEQGADVALNVAQNVRDFVVSTLNEWGIQVFVVNSVTEGGGPGTTDADYADIATRTGGQSMLLDAGNVWVDTISSALQALGGPWDDRFHVGPDVGEAMGTEETVYHRQFTFETITARTLGVSGASAVSSSTARASIDSIDSALDMMGEAKNQVGTLERVFNNIINDMAVEAINTSAANSRIEDADVALEATRLTKNMILEQTTLAAATYANSMPSQAVTLMNQQGIGAQGAFG